MANQVASYEENMLRLDEIIAALSQKDVTLEDSLTLYAEAATLIATEEKLLREAELKMVSITEALQQTLPQEDHDGV